MDRVQVTGTDFVTLSGGSGPSTVTLVNGLDAADHASASSHAPTAPT